jgi:hypothetical protein
MIKSIKAFVIGIVIWFLLTVVYGFIVGILDLDKTEFFLNNSLLNNFILLPVGIWLGFKIIKHKDNKTYRDDKTYKKFLAKTSKGVDEEISKAKDNKGTNPIDNQLVPDQHLSMLSWTVASWRLTVENSTNKMMQENKAVKFCRLFLAQEKKRKKIKDYNRADVRLLYTLHLSCPLADVDKLIAKNGWTLEVGHQFEKEIGYK